MLDSYSMTLNGVAIPISESGIAWPEDIGIFKNVNLMDQWMDVTNGKNEFIINRAFHCLDEHCRISSFS